MLPSHSYDGGFIRELLHEELYLEPHNLNFIIKEFFYYTNLLPPVHNPVSVW